jgi:SHS2 domain-containing protein
MGGSGPQRPPAGRFEQFDHAADVGIRGIGPSAAEAFRQAALALYALVASDPSRVEPARELAFELSAQDLEELLFDFLNELIYLLDAERLVGRELEVEIEPVAPGVRLRARVRGEAHDPSRHGGIVDPKGATYTGLRVAQEGGGWVAQCVVDV